MRVIAFCVVVGVVAMAGSAVAATKKTQPIVYRSAAGTVIQPTRTIIHNPDGSTTVITVQRRSYLDPGTATKYPLSEHYHDYAFPPDSASSVFYDPTDWKVNFHNRTPFPNCFDLPGFCK